MIADLMLSGAAALQQVADAVPPGVIDRMPSDRATLEGMLHALNEGPHTFVHADCRADNLFFANDAEPVFIDWQLLGDARGTLDVANLLGSGVAGDDLSDSWESLLRRYHDGLTSRGVDDYSYDELLLDYRQHLIWPLGQATSLMGALGGEDGRRVGRVSAIRALRHIAELDAFEALDER